MLITKAIKIILFWEVLRVNPSGLKLERQIAQVGAEIIGDITCDLETEIIIIGLKVLKELDLEDLTLDLNYQNLRLSFLKLFLNYLIVNYYLKQ